MEEAKVSQEKDEQRREQLLTEILLRVSALEKVLIDRGLIERKELMIEIKQSLKQLVSAMAEKGNIKDAEVVLRSIDQKLSTD
jgi:hypothetical protein